MKITDDMIDRGLQAYQEPWWSIDAGCGSHSDRLTVRRILKLALWDGNICCKCGERLVLWQDPDPTSDEAFISHSLNSDCPARNEKRFLTPQEVYDLMKGISVLDGWLPMTPPSQQRGDRMKHITDEARNERAEAQRAAVNSSIELAQSFASQLRQAEIRGLLKAAEIIKNLDWTGSGDCDITISEALEAIRAEAKKLEDGTPSS